MRATLSAALLVASLGSLGSLAACEARVDPVPELRLEQGETSRFIRWFTLSRGDEVQLVIAQKMSVVREAADAGALLTVTCDRARVWIGEAEGPADFDSEHRTVADVLSAAEEDMGVTYAATWAEPALVQTVVSLAADGSVTLVEARGGRLGIGNEEEDVAHAVLAEAIHRPESLVAMEFDASFRERPDTRATVFGPRMHGTLTNKGRVAESGDGGTWGWRGEVTVSEPEEGEDTDASVRGLLIVQMDVVPPARPHRMTWSLSLPDGRERTRLDCEVTRAD